MHFFDYHNKYTFDNGIKLEYEISHCSDKDIISITVKGKIKPSETKYSYTKDMMFLKKHFISKGNYILLHNENIDNYFIFTCKMTETGMSSKKATKFKYDIMLKPKVNHSDEEYFDLVLDVVTKMNDNFAECLNQINFMLS